MSRPYKIKKVCSAPKCTAFFSLNSEATEEVNLTFEEYETIRLIDGEGLSQAECAESMQTARTTVTSLYDSARHKLALYLINGKRMNISGGNYVLCAEEQQNCHCNCQHCPKKQNQA